MTASDGPGVRIPPPLLFGVGLIAGILLDRMLPFAVLPQIEFGVRLTLGAPFVLLGLALDLWGIVAFHRAHTTILPWGRATFLVPGGPYRFTRNPMYLGMALAYAGLALVAGSLGALLLLPLVLVVMRYYVIAREERHLEARFGDDYRAYRARVRRWL